jgi:nitrogen regulation protein NR(I)
LPSLLVVDDEANVRYSLERSLQSESLEVFTASTARQGIEAVQTRHPDVVILDVRLPDQSGLEALDRIRQINPRLPVIMITAFSTTDTAIEAMKRGALEYLLKPVDFPQLRDLVQKAIRASRLQQVPALFQEQEASAGDVDRIVGRSPAMQEVYKNIGRLAPKDVTVLIQGKSGTGKELVARALYQHSHRSQQAFLAINCAALPETLLESELFGHERGAFTGAERRRIGKFEQVDHGTLFLDEIGDMATATQAKMLRLLQEQQFERLGGSETIQTDVRIIAATNQDLQKLVGMGRFREDLYYRLSGFMIGLPDLRDRLEDLPLLVEHFLKLFNRELGKDIHGVSPEFLHLLEGHDWAGNVRELYSVIKYAMIHSVGETLSPENLPDNFLAAKPVSADHRGKGGDDDGSLDVGQLVRDLLRTGESDIYRRVCLAVDRLVYDEVLRYTRGNQVHASDLLGISRTTLRTKLRSLGLALGKPMPEEP